MVFFTQLRGLANSLIFLYTPDLFRIANGPGWEGVLFSGLYRLSLQPADPIRGRRDGLIADYVPQADKALIGTRPLCWGGLRHR